MAAGRAYEVPKCLRRGASVGAGAETGAAGGVSLWEEVGGVRGVGRELTPNLEGLERESVPNFERECERPWEEPGGVGRESVPNLERQVGASSVGVIGEVLMFEISVETSGK